MIYAVLIAASLLLPLPALAQQTSPSVHAPGATMDHATHMAKMQRAGPAVAPVEPGQAAFAAIQEIVALLEADPATDWSKVDIEALRQHLIDMDEVTLRAEVVAEPIERGARFTVTGEGRTRDAIQRMVIAHAATMDGRGGWRFAAEESPEGAILTVTVADPGDVIKVRALGFIGVMTRGYHHQEHHLMIASGDSPHH